MPALICRSTTRSCRMTYEKMVPPMTLAQYRNWAELRIAALNHALEGLPPERTRYHICWGSWNGPHMFDVPLKDIVDLVLKVDVGAYSFEAANPRHEHEWQVWKDVRLPRGQSADAGRRRAFDQHRRASRARGRAADALCRDRRARQSDGRHRLRLLAEPARRPRPPLDHVGKAANTGRRRGASVEDGLGLDSSSSRVAAFLHSQDPQRTLVLLLLQ